MGLPDPVEQASSHALLSWFRVKDGVAWVRHRWAFFLLAAFILSVISTFTPHLVSAFYLELGGRELDRVPNLKSLDYPTTYLPLLPPDSGYLPGAIAHLRRAIAWDGDNAQAYRLLGQAYLAQGDHLAAIEALTTYIGLRPDNPLGHLELAQVYDGLARASEPEIYYDFIEHLPEAAVTTPSDPVRTDYCLPGGPVASCYVASTYWTMPDDEIRPVLFMHPSSWARYVVTVPVEATMLRFSVGMYPLSWDWGGDGALFEVCIQDGAEEERLFSTHVSNAQEDWGWHEGEVDLTPYAGQVVTLTLGAHPGLRSDPTGDWAGWAEPRLEGADALQQRLEVERWWAKAVAEWQAVGLTMQDFIERGEEARKAKRYEEALAWYERAARLEPGSSDGWYYKGLAHEELGEWKEALGAYERAAALGTFSSVDWGGGPIATRLMNDTIASRYLGLAGARMKADDIMGAELLLRQALELRPGDLYARYYLRRMALAKGNDAEAQAQRQALAYFPMEAIHPSNERLLNYASEVIPALLEEGLWDRGKALNVISYLVWQHHGTAGVERLLERLMERYPTQPDWAFCLAELYHRRGDLDRAEAIYRQAFMVDPEYAQAYLRLGMVTEAKSQIPNPESEEQLAAAARWYEQYHMMAPDDLLGLKRLAEACTALEEAGVGDRGCQEAALGEALEARADDQRFVAELLGVPVEDVELGPNLVGNGSFGEGKGGQLESWNFWTYLGPDGKGLYFAGIDSLAAGGNAARIVGLRGGPMDDGTTTYGEYRGAELVLPPGDWYLISVRYRSQNLDGNGLLFVGENSKGGVRLTHSYLEDSSGEWRRVSTLVPGRGWEMTVIPVVRNWGLGSVWFDDVEVRPIGLPEMTTLDTDEKRKQ
jgi:tetratricopeptide (TPR) repeat protein